jgi:putative two-component system response regulator
VAAAIHDLGKISIPSEILSKPGRLLTVEFALVKSHAETGHEILASVTFPWPVADAVHQHHERLDGSGYPQGLKGDDILLEARIIGVADVVEAMASHRPYRAALGVASALTEIQGQAGTLYDPVVVAATVRLFQEQGYQLK